MKIRALEPGDKRSGFSSGDLESVKEIESAISK
jgi:hypothetical protein